jgi:uncharacterized protein YlxW (UPF0749 family)
MEKFNLDFIAALSALGLSFGAAWKLVPVLLEYLTKKSAGQSTLNELAFKASGMTLEALIAVVNKLEQMVQGLESRITKQRDEYDEDITALKKRYEEELSLLIQRHNERSKELLNEISALKTELGKYKTMRDVVEDEPLPPAKAEIPPTV